jgi:hypothetical protein
MKITKSLSEDKSASNSETINLGIIGYNDTQAAADKAICDLLAKTI